MKQSRLVSTSGKNWARVTWFVITIRPLLTSCPARFLQLWNTAIYHFCKKLLWLFATSVKRETRKRNAYGWKRTVLFFFPEDGGSTWNRVLFLWTSVLLKGASESVVDPEKEFMWFEYWIATLAIYRLNNSLIIS